MTAMACKNGIITRSVRGFYFVETSDGIYRCEIKGTFRNKNERLLVGDRVEIECSPSESNLITAVMPRKNRLLRPLVANVDIQLVVISVKDPSPNYLVIDKMLTVAERNGIKPILIISKTDLSNRMAEEIKSIYKNCHYEMFFSNDKGMPKAKLDRLKKLIKDKTCAICGNTGAGKSTLLNMLDPELSLETGETSKKLGRGRHTTREVSFFRVCGALIADTPGFSSIDIHDDEIIKKEDLVSCFPDINAFVGGCRFINCSHTKERDCSVKQALERGEVNETRYNSYLNLYAEAEKVKEWNKSKK